MEGTFLKGCFTQTPQSPDHWRSWRLGLCSGAVACIRKLPTWGELLILPVARFSLFFPQIICSVFQKECCQKNRITVTFKTGVFVVYDFFCASLHAATSRTLWFFQTGENSCVRLCTNSSSPSSCCSRNWDCWHSSMRRAIFLKLLTPPYWRSWMPSILYVMFCWYFLCKLCRIALLL